MHHDFNIVSGTFSSGFILCINGLGTWSSEAARPVDKNCWTLQGSISETNEQSSRLADQKWHSCNWIGWCWCNDLQRLLGPDYELSTECILWQEYGQNKNSIFCVAPPCGYWFLLFTFSHCDAGCVYVISLQQEGPFPPYYSTSFLSILVDALFITQ